MKQSNSRWAVNFTALVLAAGLLIGLLTGCPHNQPPAKPVDPAAILNTDGHGTITGCKCAKEELPAFLMIPAKIGNEEIKEIGSNAFKDCTRLRNVDLPKSLTKIGSGAFLGCTGLTSISLPASLTTIDGRAFSSCTGLTSLTIDSANAAYKTEGNILYNKAGTILILAAGGLTSVTIPNTVTTIGKNAFYGCEGLTSISLPTNLTTIGEEAFFCCTKLTSISLPASLTKIDRDAFLGCTGLTSISLPENLTKIGSWAFAGCEGLTSVIFADTNGWKVYDNDSYSGTSTPINSSDLNNAATAAKYLREKTYKGGYCDKYWKKD